MRADNSVFDIRLIDAKELRKLVPYSRTTIWRLEKSGLFPNRIKLGPCRVAWSYSDVTRWIECKRQGLIWQSDDGLGCEISMPSVVFTNISIKRLKSKPDQQFEIFDKSTTGLGLRVSSGGAKSFFLLYRIGGRNRRLGFGRYPVVSLAKARQRARDALSQVALNFRSGNQENPRPRRVCEQAIFDGT
jgi:predicted DNA-binding transcriptional regulator AlpA